MENIVVTRSEIHEKIKELIVENKDPIEVKNKVDQWLQTTGCTDFDRKQILNDLTSYQEYLDII